MNLIYFPGACSLADHIALIEAGLPYKLISINRDKQTDDGRDFLAINPKGYVPALELDDGTVLTENLAILCYIATQSGKLLPKYGMTHWRALERDGFRFGHIRRWRSNWRIRPVRRCRGLER
jgi:glutathione S-transferase